MRISLIESLIYGRSRNREFTKSPRRPGRNKFNGSRRFLIPTRVPRDIAFGSLSSRSPFVRARASCLFFLLRGPARKKTNEKIDGLMRNAERTRDGSLNWRVSIPSRDRPETLRPVLSLLSFSTRFVLFCVRLVLRYALDLRCIATVYVSYLLAA